MRGPFDNLSVLTAYPKSMFAIHGKFGDILLYSHAHMLFKATCRDQNAFDSFGGDDIVCGIILGKLDDIRWQNNVTIEPASRTASLAGLIIRRPLKPLSIKTETEQFFGNYYITKLKGIVRLAYMSKEINLWVLLG